MKRFHSGYLVAMLFTAIFCRAGLLFSSQWILPLQRLLDVGDAVGYEQLARNILASAGFRFATGEATAFRMPGYPIFLALVYAIWDSKLAAQVIQVLFDALTVWVTWAVARETTPQEIAWYVAPLLVAVHPLLIITSLMLTPETLTTAILALATWVMIRLLRTPSLHSRRGLIVMLFFGLVVGVYLKPTVASVVGLAGAVLFILSIQHDSWRQALGSLSLAVVVTGIALSPWIVRNYFVMEAFVPLTTSSGVNLYKGNNPEAHGGAVSTIPLVLPGMSEVESNAVLTQKAVDWIRVNPVRFLALLPRKAARHWSPFAFHEAGDFPLPDVLQVTAVLLYSTLYLLVLLGCQALVRRGRWLEAAALLVVPIGLFVPSLIASGATRLALPSFPQLAVLAALGIAQLGNRLKWIRRL